MENKPVIITIGRQFGSGGREIGEKLAHKLNIGYYDKALIEEAGLTLGTIHEESATGVAVGTVFAQSPEAGQQMRSGDAVEIWVARELVMATGTYPLTLEIEQDDSLVTIFLQEEGFYREVSTMNCDRGTLEVELNLESETPGEKTLIVFVNDEEAARDTVTLRVEEDEE